MKSALIIAAALAIAVFVIAADAGTPSKATIAQGDYIANRVALCGHCHTPMTKAGKPDARRLYAGNVLKMKPPPDVPKWTAKVPNLTRAGLLKSWPSAAVEKFLMTGVGPDGDRANPPMPQYRLNAKDARAVTAYLRSLPAAK